MDQSASEILEDINESLKFVKVVETINIAGNIHHKDYKKTYFLGEPSETILNRAIARTRIMFECFS